MLYSEIKKIMRIPILLGILLLLLLKIFSITLIGKSEAEADPAYEGYIDTLKGPLTLEKETYILKEQDKILNVLEKKEQMEADYLNERITNEVYAEYNDQLFYAESHKQAIEQIYADYEYLKSLEGTSFTPEFLYYRYWNHFFAPDTVDIFMIFCLVFLPCFYFSTEHTSNMWMVIHAAYRGKMRMINTKILACMITTSVITLLFFLIELISYIFCFGINQFNADIQSLSLFANLPLHLSIGQSVLLLGMGRTLATSLVSMVLFLISYLLHQDRINFLVCFALIIFPVLFKEQFQTAYQYTFYPLLNGVSRVIYTTGEDISKKFILMFSIWVSSIIVFVVLYFLVYIRIYKRKS